MVLTGLLCELSKKMHVNLQKLLSMVLGIQQALNNIAKQTDAQNRVVSSIWHYGVPPSKTKKEYSTRVSTTGLAVRHPEVELECWLHHLLAV